MRLPHRVDGRSRATAPRAPFAAPRDVLLAVSLVVSLAGCRDVIARFDDDAVVHLSARSCPDTMTAVGDSLRLDAVVRIEDTWEGMSMPGDRDTLYTSAERPRAFRWEVADSLPTARDDRFTRSIRADITPEGVLVARATGSVWVRASSAGRRSVPLAVAVMPRVTHFAVTPRDTTIAVGDTITLRLSFLYEGEREPYRYFRWDANGPPPPGPYQGLLSTVERDPDDRSLPPVGEWTPAHRQLALERSLQRTMVAERPGTARFAPCAAGSRRDSATVRITGTPREVVRDVPPVLRLETTPADTALVLGQGIGATLRIVDAASGNGPYRWRLTTGDGWDTTGTWTSHRGGSAFGSEQPILHEHAFVDTGTFAVAVVVTDSAGRATTVAGPRYRVAPLPAATLLALPFDSTRTLRLGDGEQELAIAVLGQDVRELDVRQILSMPGSAREFGVAPLRFGRTVFDQNRRGMRREERDVNEDGVPDVVFYLDREALRRNGDLRPGRNRLVMTGVVALAPMRRGRRPGTWFAPPVRGVAEFTVVP